MERTAIQGPVEAADAEDCGGSQPRPFAAGPLPPDHDWQEMPEGDEVDLTALALTVLRGKRTVLLSMLAALGLGVAAAFLLKPTYTAEASFVPPSSGSTGSSILSQLGGLGGVGGLGGLKSPGDIYVGILGSRTIEDDLIRRFGLLKVYGVKYMSDAEKILEGNSKFAAGVKDTIVTVSVRDHDAARARDLANAYLGELMEQNGRLALTESGQRRLFFEEQLKQGKDALADAEVDLKRTEEKSGFIAPTGQTQVEIETIAQTRAEIASREVQLAALRQSSTEQNPDIVRIHSEIANLTEQLAREQSGSGAGAGAIPTSKVPELALEYVRKAREVAYREALFEMLAKQYEAAKLDESRSAPVLQVLDYAVLPDRKSGPPRMLIALGCAMLGFVFGILRVLWRQRMLELKSDPEMGARIAELRNAASLR